MPRHSPTDLENLRRSAAMAPLPAVTIQEIIDAYLELIHERERLEQTLAELQPAWVIVRRAMNELATEFDPKNGPASTLVR